jgi:hypothetical protein
MKRNSKLALGGAAAVVITTGVDGAGRSWPLMAKASDKSVTLTAELHELNGSCAYGTASSGR